MLGSRTLDGKFVTNGRVNLKSIIALNASICFAMFVDYAFSQYL